MADKDDIKVAFIRRPRQRTVKLPEDEKVRRPPTSRKTMNA